MAVVLLMLAAVAADGQTNWPGFLGAGQVHVKPQSLPLAWSAKQNIAWQTKLTGYGQSSPVVWQQQVFVTAIEGPMKDTCHIQAVSLADGKALWRHSFESS